MTTTETYTEHDIIRKIRSGEIALFEILIRRNNSLLYKTGRGYGFNHEDTQDIMQDTFIDAYINLSGFEERSSFKTWILKIMLNHCYRKHRKASFSREMKGGIQEKSVPMFTDEQQTDLNKLTNDRELGKIIESALQQIPLEYRMVFTLREINGISVQETAEAMNITDNNVKVRLNRAKALLRKEVEKSYSPEEIYDFNLIFCDAMVERIMSRIAKH